MSFLRPPLPVLFTFGLLFGNATAQDAPSRVEVRKLEIGYRLVRNGESYPIRGVGGTERLPLLKQLGGNSIRTWGADNLGELLDEAQQNGLTVCVGIWLGHERHGFDYTDETAVLKQLDTALDVVRTYKNHPAVLLWGIGNEMEGDGGNPAVWYAVDHIARECKRIDPHHPTMTVIAELGENKIRRLNRFCPHIDIVGINSYGGVESVATRYREQGGNRPYIVTEHGPLGPWEVGKTAWGSPIEASSTQKASRYANGYKATAVADSELCLGTYAFLWGWKQETTATWFGMLLPDGSKLGAADAMSAVWTGTPPRNLCPTITELTLDRETKLKPGEQITATLTADDPEGEPVAIKWVLRSDAGTIGVGGDAQAEERAFASGVQAEGMSATVTVPEGGGGYRLFAYVRDPKGNAAVANVPFQVDAPVKPVAARKPKLPLVLFADDLKAPPFAPSGYMGKTDAITMTVSRDVPPHSGDASLKVTYSAVDEWGGVLWQAVPDDWEGTKPGGFDLSNASELEFRIRGERGGEVVNFLIGGDANGNPYADTAKAELKNIRLTTEWQTLRIPLSGRDASRIKTGFGWSLAGQGQPVTFYLDDLRYVSAE